MADRKRQANVDGGRKSVWQVRVSESENTALVEAAEAAGVSVQRLMVESALASESGETATERRETITALLMFQGQLAAIGNNLNQIARVANSTGQIGRELTHSISSLQRSIGAVTEAAEAVSNEYRRHRRNKHGGR